MFSNDSNTSLVMVASPYHPTGNAYTYKPASAVAFNQLDPRLAPRPQHNYYHQHRTIEIIQLEEVPAPSRREHLSVPSSSSFASTSYASSSACSEDEEDEDVAVESYCSSEEDEESEEECLTDEPARVAADSFHSRMRRIEQWRDTYAKAVGAQFAPSPSRCKRKNDFCDDEDDTFSHSSKRSRQGSITGSASTSTSASVRSVHSCSACDAWFPDRGSLHKHGFSPRTNEACRAAVEYDCEQ